MRDKKKNNTWRAPEYFFTVVLISFFVMSLQLSYIALCPTIYGINMEEFAANRNTYSTTLYAKRGSFYDKDGHVLAQDVSSYTVIAYLYSGRTVKDSDPKHVVDKKKTAKALAPILKMTEERLMELLSKDAYQVELGPGGRGITELVKEEIEALHLPGIDFIETFKRYYPNGNFASYIIGYAKKYEETSENGEITEKLVGELGLESKYNNLLTGKNGYLKYQQDRHGYKIPDTEEERTEAVDGDNVYLTLDSNIQRFAESAIKDLEKKYKPKWATIAVMDAKTGNLLAAATSPSFDPNLRNIKDYQSPLVTYTFEPGSVMKIFSYLCAVDSGKYKSNITVQSGSLKIGDDTVRDWNRVGWGRINLDQGLLYSSNVAASTLVQKVITKSELRDCYDKLGFGEQTGIELANESKGKVSFTYPIETATATFGQGMTTTVTQLLKAMTVLANDGKVATPHIVNKIIDPNTKKTVYESTTEYSEQLFKTSSINYVTSLLYDSVNGTDPNATGHYYKIKDYQILGKTGTAQIASSKGGYLQGDNDYLRSFLGMWPKKDPKVIIYVGVQQPKSGGATPVINTSKTMIKNITKYMGMFDTSSSSSSVELVTLESFKNKSTEKIEEELTSKKIKVIKIGEGDKIIDQYPKSGTVVLSKDTVVLITNDNKYKLPDLKGYSKKFATNVLELLKVKYKIEGTGYVTKQSIKPDTEITKDMVVELTLSEKFDLSKVE